MDSPVALPLIDLRPDQLLHQLVPGLREERRQPQIMIARSFLRGL